MDGFIKPSRWGCLAPQSSHEGGICLWGGGVLYDRLASYVQAPGCWAVNAVHLMYQMDGRIIMGEICGLHFWLSSAGGGGVYGGRVLKREYWIFYRRPSFPVVVWFSRQQVVFHSQSSCVSPPPVELTNGRGVGVGEEPHHTTARKPDLFKSFKTLWGYGFPKRLASADFVGLLQTTITAWYITRPCPPPWEE